MGWPGDSEFGGLTRTPLRESSLVDGAVEMWSAALRPGSNVKDMAWVYQEREASKVAVQAQAVPSSERDVYKMAAAAGMIFSLDMSMHLKISAVVCE